MTIWRLRRLLEAYGAGPERWPAGQRARADALLARSARARRLLAEAQALDALLMSDAARAADERLAAAIVARVTAAPQERPTAAPRAFRIGWSPSKLWPQALGLAAAAVLGFVVGWTDLLPLRPGGTETIDLVDFLDVGAGSGEPLL